MIAVLVDDYPAVIGVSLMPGQIIDINDIIITQSVIDDPQQQQTAVLRRYWKATAQLGAITFTQASITVDAVLTPLYVQLIYNGATTRGTEVKRAFPTHLDAWGVTSNILAGVAGAIGLPPQTSGLLSLYSLTIGKHGRGRQYVPFPSSSSNQLSGLPSVGYITDLDNLGNALVTPLTITVGAAFVTLTPGAWDPIAAAFYPWSRSVSRPSWATQRRRSAFGRFNVPPF